MLFVCVRCSRQVSNEEQYIIFDSSYCRACINSKLNDPSEIYDMNLALRGMMQIEN